jgi:7-cyano-7-deazaguanine reductase
MSKTPRKSPKLPDDLQLGRAVEWPTSPEQAKLDRVPNPQKDTNYVVRFTAPEFTSLCPITGQPDFAHLVIDYLPGEWLVESKSLKLYLARSAITAPSTRIAPWRSASARRAAQAEMAAHRRLLVSARRHPDRRVLADRKPPKGVWVPEQGVAPYRGRWLGLRVRGLHRPAAGFAAA